MKLRTEGLALVAIVLGLTAWAEYVLLAIAVPAAWDEEQSTVLVILIWTEVSVGFMLVAYFRTMLTDPGEVPETYGDPSEAVEGFNANFCNKCNMPKPERAHHCSICKRCVLKMDHHCPWVNNCVGHYNYRFFIMFLLYTSSACTSVCVGMFSLRGGEGIDRLQMSVLGFILGFFGLVLWSFLGFHLYLLAKNMTSLESFAAQDGRDDGLVSYDVGAKNNITQVCGPYVFCWFCPCQPTNIPNGVTWPRPDVDMPSCPVPSP